MRRTQCDGCSEVIEGPHFHAAVADEQPFGSAATDGLPDDWDWCPGCTRMALAALAALVTCGGRLRLELPEVAVAALAGGSAEYVADVAGLPIVLVTR